MGRLLWRRWSIYKFQWRERQHSIVTYSKKYLPKYRSSVQQYWVRVPRDSTICKTFDNVTIIKPNITFKKLLKKRISNSE